MIKLWFYQVHFRKNIRPDSYISFKHLLLLIYNYSSHTRLKLRPANERRHYFVTMSLIVWAQLWYIRLEMADDMKNALSRTKIFAYVSLGHGYVIKWKHSPRYWPFVGEIHRSPVDSPHKGQWREALVISLIRVWTKVSANNWDVGDLRRHRANHDVTVMGCCIQ